jgi:uncharacterized protein YjiS (DUF1127 family)
MTYLRTFQSDVDETFRLLLRKSATVAFAVATDAALAAWRSWRLAMEARRDRRNLTQINEHLLRDIGLTRVDVRFGGDFKTLDQHHRMGAFR